MLVRKFGSIWGTRTTVLLHSPQHDGGQRTQLDSNKVQCSGLEGPRRVPGNQVGHVWSLAEQAGGRGFCYQEKNVTRIQDLLDNKCPNCL